MLYPYSRFPDVHLTACKEKKNLIGFPYLRCKSIIEEILYSSLALHSVDASSSLSSGGARRCWMMDRHRRSTAETKFNISSYLCAVYLLCSFCPWVRRTLNRVICTWCWVLDHQSYRYARKAGLVPPTSHGHHPPHRRTPQRESTDPDVCPRPWCLT